jgi:hypothetical protein
VCEGENCRITFGEPMSDTRVPVVVIGMRFRIDSIGLFEAVVNEMADRLLESELTRSVRAAARGGIIQERIKQSVEYSMV